MTKIEELEQKLDNAVEKFRLEMNECKKELAELKESKKEGKWKPTVGEWYWFRVSDGTTKQTANHDLDVDRWRIEHLPIFPTEEECKKYWHFMDTVKEKSYEFSKEEWEDDKISKYIISYSHYHKEFCVSTMTLCTTLGEFYFKNKSDAQYIIDNFKEELMTYWL